MRSWVRAPHRSVLVLVLLWMTQVVVLVAGLFHRTGVPRVPSWAGDHLTPEITEGRVISQTMALQAPGFHEITIQAEAVSSETGGLVRFGLIELTRDDEERLVRSRSVPAGEGLADPEYTIRFDALMQSAGQRYRLDVMMPGTPAGQGIVLRAADGRWTNGGSIFVNGQEGFSEIVFATDATHATPWGRLVHHFLNEPGRHVALAIILPLFGLSQIAAIAIWSVTLAAGASRPSSERARRRPGVRRSA